jgi:hypothetical protein
MLEKRLQRKLRSLQKLPKILSSLLIPDSSKERKTPEGLQILAMTMTDEESPAGQ